MTVPACVGIETEYGIVVTGRSDLGPIVASELVVEAHRALAEHWVPFDVSAEHPDRDARLTTPLVTEPVPLLETAAAGIVLTNGARLYVDHAHPEYATPECRTATDAVTWDRAGERILLRAARAATAALGGHGEVLVHKNNTDGKGAAYGTHENLLVDRVVPFGLLARHLLPFLVSRLPLVGAGRLGSQRDPAVGFQLSQRADFLENDIGLETTVRRPIVNTRDEPHADHERHRRLHVITGDANLCEVAALVKVGSILLLLEVLTAGGLGEPDDLADPVAAAHRVSHDASCTALLETRDGRRVSALDLQERLLDACTAHVAREGARDDQASVLAQWGRVLDALRRDPDALDGVLDWVTKRRLIRAYAERHGLAADDARLRLIDLQYHDLRPDRGLHARLEARGAVERVVDDGAIERAVTEPPADTRAWLRGRAVARWPGRLLAAGWDGLVLAAPAGPTRVALPDPTGATRAELGDELAGLDDPDALARRLAAPRADPGMGAARP